MVGLHAHMLLGGCAVKEFLAACAKHYSAQAVDTCRDWTGEHRPHDTRRWCGAHVL